MESTELHDSPVHRLLDCIGVCDISHDSQRAVLAANGLRLAHALLYPGLVEVKHRHARASANEPQRDRMADANRTASPGDDCDFSAQWSLSHRAILPCSEFFETLCVGAARYRFHLRPP